MPARISVMTLIPPSKYSLQNTERATPAQKATISQYQLIILFTSLSNDSIAHFRIMSTVKLHKDLRIKMLKLVILPKNRPRGSCAAGRFVNRHFTQKKSAPSTAGGGQSNAIFRAVVSECEFAFGVYHFDTDTGVAGALAITDKPIFEGCG